MGIIDNHSQRIFLYVYLETGYAMVHYPGNIIQDLSRKPRLGKFKYS